MTASFVIKHDILETFSSHGDCCVHGVYMDCCVHGLPAHGVAVYHFILWMPDTNSLPCQEGLCGLVSIRYITSKYL